jgi:amino acid adenylation domain-containing protein
MEYQTNIVLSFEDQVRLFPEHIAVIFHGKQHTFHAINRKANQLAQYLIGARLSGSQVGISLPRSENIITSILGVLKAGCTYVFLDPQYPKERIMYILEHSDIKLLITQGKFVSTNNGHNIGTLNPDAKQLSTCSTENPETTIPADTPAYIMYTSGSTGKPKGSVITHSNVIHYIGAINEVVVLNKNDRYLHTASFSFSSSVRQYLLPLLNGVTLVIADERTSQSLLKLLQLVKDEEVSIMDNIQSLWRYGVTQLERLPVIMKESLIDSRLRLVIFSGELLSAQLIAHIRSAFAYRSPSLINLYGQTETIGGVAYPLPDEFFKETGPVPVGFPLSNTTVYLLDHHMNPVKKGESGEVYLSGPSIGREYFNNKDQTSKYFIQHQFGGDKAIRLFRTGDIARITEDDAIEITGRTDFQVKIRGIRVETSEIEEALTSHPHITEAVVVAFENGDGETKLAAFIVKPSSQQLTAEEIKIFLKNKLPIAFIPDTIIRIEKIPLNPNGKTDRKALQEMMAALKTEKAEEKIPGPENENQKIIFNLFSRLLDLKSFHHTDSFFDLGGHSLKAVELVEMLEQIFNKKIPVDLVYKYASVKQLAQAIEKIKPRAEYTNLVCIQPRGTMPAFFCVHADDANFFLPRFIGNDIPYYGFFHQGQNGEKILYTSIDGIARKYVSDLLKEQAVGPYILGGYSIGGVIAFEMARQLIELGHCVKLLFLIDSLCPGYQGNLVNSAESHAKVNPNPVPDKSFLFRQKSYMKLRQKLQIKLFKFAYYPCLLLVLLNIKLPLFLRNSYIMGVYRRARKQYKPSVNGHYKTILFRTTINNYEDPFLGWGSYLSDNLQVYEIEADHNSVIKEPHIRKIADIIAAGIRSHFSR